CPPDTPLPVLAGADVIVGAGFSGPPRVDARVERPVGEIDALDGVGGRLDGELVRGEPLAAVPAANEVARLRLRLLHWQERLGPDRLLHLLVWHQRGGTAELAALLYLGCGDHR